MHGSKTTPVHQFTEEEMLTEGREPVPEDRKQKPEDKAGIGIERYVPWYRREESMLLYVANDDLIQADLIARSKRYDEIVELRWLKMSRIKMQNDSR